MRENNGFYSFALDSAHVKYGVWPGRRSIRSVLLLVINKSDSCCAVVRFCYHSYDYRQNWAPLSPIVITNSEVQTSQQIQRVVLLTEAPFVCGPCEDVVSNRQQQ